MTSTLIEREMKQAETALDALDAVFEAMDAEDGKYASAVGSRAAAVSEFAFTQLVSKFPGLCDNVDRSIEEIDAEIKKVKALETKWKNAKVQGARAAVHAAALVIVGKIFGDLASIAISAAASVLTEGVIALFLKALVALKEAKKRKVLKEFDPKMVKACEAAKKQKARDVEKTIQKVDKGASFHQIKASFETLDTLLDALDNEKVAGTIHVSDIEEKLAGLSDAAFSAAVKKLPGLCKFIDADVAEIEAEIKRLDRDIKHLHKELLIDSAATSVGVLAGGLLASLFFGPGIIPVAGLGLAVYWAIFGLAALFVQGLHVLRKMKIRGRYKNEKIYKICQMYGDKGVSKQKIRKLLDEFIDENPNAIPAETRASAVPTEEELVELEAAAEKLYILGEKLTDPKTKEALIRDKAVHAAAKQWKKFVDKVPGVCRYLHMTQSGLQEVIDNVQKELAFVKKNWNGRNAEAAKGAAVGMLARAAGKSDYGMIAEAALPVIERIVVLYLKAVFFVQKVIARRTIPAILYDALTEACEEARAPSAPDEKVILKEETRYEKQLKDEYSNSSYEWSR